MSFIGLAPPPFFLPTPGRPSLPWEQWEQMFNVYLLASGAAHTGDKPWQCPSCPQRVPERGTWGPGPPATPQPRSPDALQPTTSQLPDVLQPATPQPRSPEALQPATPQPLSADVLQPAVLQPPSPRTQALSPGIPQQQSTSPSPVRRPTRPVRKRRPPAWLQDYQTN
ncbi:uncharacterized protein [Dermacentor albipictus]|uniref:uncharacterized protein n=1 Tax=Dermacentor albipictus TaxID=60249 RepID=UPI0038FC4ADF